MQASILLDQIVTLTPDSNQMSNVEKKYGLTPKVPLARSI